MTDQPKVTKPCPECGHPLTIRVKRATNEEFLGCSHYPECRYTEKLPEYFRLKRMGAPILF